MIPSEADYPYVTFRHRFINQIIKDCPDKANLRNLIADAKSTMPRPIGLDMTQLEMTSIGKAGAENPTSIYPAKPDPIIQPIWDAAWYPLTTSNTPGPGMVALET